MQIVGEAAAGYAKAGYFTIVEGIVLPGWFVEPLRDHLRNRGLDVALAILRPSLDICTERAGQRPSRRLGDPLVVEQLWRSFSSLDALERYVIDSGNQGPDETAEIVSERLRRGLLTIS